MQHTHTYFQLGLCDSHVHMHIRYVNSRVHKVYRQPMFYALLPLPTTLPTREFTCSGSFFLDDGNLHVFDLDTDQEEVDLPNHYVPQVIPANNNTQSIRTGSQYVALPRRVLPRR